MSCKQVNLTEEEVKNAFINGNLLWKTSKDDTKDDIVERFNWVRKTMKLPPGENQKYTILNWTIGKRVSNEFAKRAWEAAIGKSRVARETSKPDNLKKKELGIKVHQVMADIANQLYYDIGDLASIRKAVILGDYGLNERQFNELVKLVRNIIDDIQKTQDSIKEGEKATLLIEQPIVDPLHNIGGTMDITAIFSDKTQSIYDYKVVMSHGKNYDFQNGQLVDDLMGIDRVNEYSLNMTEYKRISQEVFGTGHIREIRLIPIHARLQLKPKELQEEFDILSTKIEILQTVGNEYLKPIPLTGETTGYKGIDEMIERQWILLNRLTKDLMSKKTSSTDKASIRKRISLLRKSIQKAIVDGDIDDIINSVIILINGYQDRVGHNEFLANGITKDKKYLTDSDLQEMLGEMAMYADLIDNTHHYFTDLKEEDPKEYERLNTAISTVIKELLDSMAAVKIENEKRIMDTVLDRYLHKDKDGNLLPLEELPFFTRNMTRFSDIDHPYFKAGWELIQKSYFNIRRDVKKMQDEINKVENDLFTWTKANNIKRMDALMRLVDKKSGNLVSELSRELIKKISDAYSIYKPEESFVELSKIFEIKDIEEYRKRYIERLERYKETQVSKYARKEDDPGYKKDIANWIRVFDLENSFAAWQNKSNRGNLKIKDSVREANLSEEYKKIKEVKPLLAYYNMYVEYNNLFRKMLDIDQYDDLPPNFIANVRKTMVDHIAIDKLAVGAAINELIDSFHVREEDIHISDVDETGNVKRNIPVLYLSPFINEKGEIDNIKKSYDLSKNLMLFGKMAYNYKYMHEIEPKILQLREAMAHPIDLPGTKVTDKRGRDFKGYIKEKATKHGIDTDTYKLFEELTDAYLYGIKFKDSNFKNSGVDFTKLILKMKQYYGKSTLAFAVIPGVAAYVAGNMSQIFEAKKGISYNSKQLRQAWYHLVTDFKKYRALSLYFDVYAEDPTTVLIENKSVNFLSRLFTYRNLMYPLRKTDENINDSILNAMSLNWGVDIEGKLGKKNALVRLNRKDLDTTGIRSIWELSKLDDKTGRMYIEGITDKNGNITSEEAYIAFRNAVKTTSSGVIGSLSQEDLFRGDTNLMYNVMFQFKSWMLGIGRERFGDLTIDERLQAGRWGRFKALTSEFGFVDSDYDTGLKLRGYISNVFLPNVAKLAFDIATFGISPRTGLFMDTYTDEQGRTRNVRTNIKRARRMYIKYILKNKQLEGQMSFDQFLEVKEAQMKAGIVEIRTMIMFLIAIHLLGAGGGDDKEPPPYMANWFSRFVYKNLTKAQSELSFMWSAPQLFKLISNPVPMSGLLTRSLKTVFNGFDETRDFFFGEDSLNDKTPFPYYTIQWIYGGGQAARLFELYKQFEKSPYTVTISGY